MVSLSVLFCSTRPVPVSPETEPLMDRVPVEQEITMLPTLVEAAPLPLATLQICVGFVGCARTVALKDPLRATAVAKVHAPPLVVVRLSAPLSCRIRPVTERPV